MRQRTTAIMKQQGAAGLSIAVVDGQDVVWAESFGVARREDGAAATNRTVYEVGSLSKPFVGIAVMQLVESGELDLDAPLTDYIPEFEIHSRFPGPNVPTLRQLLSHRSGLPSEVPGLLEREDYTIEQLPDALRAQWLVQPPGRMAIYSSVGIDLAALVVERTTGTEFAEHLRGAVLEPLGMPGASLRVEDVETTELATGYDWLGHPTSQFGATPSASLRASITELVQLARWLNGRGRVGASQVLAQQSVIEMLRPQNAERPLDLGARVGLTWFIEPGSEATGDIVRHVGTTDGFMAEVKLLPKHGIGVVALSNNNLLSVLPRIVDEALGRAFYVKAGLYLDAELRKVETVPPSPKAELDSRALDTLASTAYSDGSTLLRFKRRRRKLLAPLPGERTLVLTPREDGTFDAEARDKLGRRSSDPFPARWISFETLDGEQVMVARGGRTPWLYAKRFEPGALARGWEARTGRYRPVGTSGPVEALEVGIENGALRIKAQVPGQSKPLVFVLEVHSEELATVAGIGRGAGVAVVAFERDGAPCLRSQGLEFMRER